MLTTPEQITQFLKQLQEIVNNKTAKHPLLERVTEELDSIARTLNAGKLKVQIFSQSPKLLETLLEFLTNQSNLTQFYQFNTFDILSRSQSAKASSELILQSNNATYQNLTSWKLSPGQNILIGREHQNLSGDYRNQNSLLIPLPMYSTVSGVHLEIRPTTDFGSNSITWQICDLNSSNGTYVNGKRLYGCQILNVGDRITLGRDNSSQKCLEFMVSNSPTTVSYASSSLLKENELTSSVDCNVACLVVDSCRNLTALEDQLIDAISKRQVMKLILITNISAGHSQLTAQENATLTQLADWIKTRFPHLPFNLVSLPLHLTHPSNFQANPAIQQQLNRLYSELIISQGEFQVVFLKQLVGKLLYQLSRFEEYLEIQFKQLDAEIERIEQKLQRKEIYKLPSHLKKVIREFRDKKEQFFSQAKAALFRSKKDFISEFKSDSLHHRVQLLVNSLKPVVSRKDGEVSIELQDEASREAHQVVMQFYETELADWANQQWEQVYYGRDSLHQLIQQGNTSLSSAFFPSLPNLWQQQPQRIDVQQSLHTSLRVMPAHASYSQPSLGQEVAGGAAKIVFKLGIKVGVKALFMGPIALLDEGINIFFDQFMGEFPKGLSEATKGEDVIPDLAADVFDLIHGIPSQAQREKLEEVVKKLREESCAHYQRLGKYLLERLVEDMEKVLQAEERQLDRASDKLEHLAENYLNELERGMNRCRYQRTNLMQEKLILTNLKNSILHQSATYDV